MRQILFTLALLSASCTQGYTLTVFDLAEAADTSCLHSVPDTSSAALDAAWKELRRQGISICRWDQPFSTAFDGRLCLSKNFDDKSTFNKARTLHHELVHYCQRAAIPAFTDWYLTDPPAMFIAETQARHQEVLSTETWGATCSVVHRIIDETPEKFADAPYRMGYTNLEAVIPILEEGLDRCK